MKVAVSIPDQIYDQAEHLIEKLGVPRSQVYAQAIAQFVQANSDAAVTQRLNEVYAVQAAPVDHGLAMAQFDVLRGESEEW